MFRIRDKVAATVVAKNQKTKIKEEGVTERLKHEPLTLLTIGQR